MIQYWYDRDLLLWHSDTTEKPVTDIPAGGRYRKRKEDRTNAK